MVHCTVVNMVPDIKSIVQEGGERALYQNVKVERTDGTSVELPRYETLGLNSWELKELLAHPEVKEASMNYLNKQLK